MRDSSKLAVLGMVGKRYCFENCGGTVGEMAKWLLPTLLRCGVPATMGRCGWAERHRSIIYVGPAGDVKLWNYSMALYSTH